MYPTHYSTPGLERTLKVNIGRRARTTPVVAVVVVVVTQQTVTGDRPGALPAYRRGQRLLPHTAQPAALLTRRYRAERARHGLRSQRHSSPADTGQRGHVTADTASGTPPPPIQGREGTSRPAQPAALLTRRYRAERARHGRRSQRHSSPADTGQRGHVTAGAATGTPPPPIQGRQGTSRPAQPAGLLTRRYRAERACHGRRSQRYSSPADTGQTGHVTAGAACGTPHPPIQGREGTSRPAQPAALLPRRYRAEGTSRPAQPAALLTRRYRAERARHGRRSQRHSSPADTGQRGHVTAGAASGTPHPPIQGREGTSRPAQPAALLPRRYRAERARHGRRSQRHSSPVGTGQRGHVTAGAASGTPPPSVQGREGTHGL